MNDKYCYPENRPQTESEKMVAKTAGFVLLAAAASAFFYFSYVEFSAIVAEKRMANRTIYAIDAFKPASDAWVRSGKSIKDISVDNLLESGFISHAEITNLETANGIVGDFSITPAEVTPGCDCYAGYTIALTVDAAICNDMFNRYLGKWHWKTILTASSGEKFSKTPHGYQSIRCKGEAVGISYSIIPDFGD